MKNLSSYPKLTEILFRQKGAVQAYVFNYGGNAYDR